MSTLLHWTISFAGRGPEERTITLPIVFARRALEMADGDGGVDRVTPAQPAR